MAKILASTDWQIGDRKIPTTFYRPRTEKDVRAHEKAHYDAHYPGWADSVRMTPLTPVLIEN